MFGETGVGTFVVSGIRTFNPGEQWAVVED
jgi:hypothetical protein